MAVFLSKCEAFLTLIPDLQCHFCQNVPGPNNNNRYSCIDAAHTLCEDHKTKCPCGSWVGKSPSPLIAKLLQNLPWVCQNYKNGCRESKIDVKDLDHHEGKCIYRQVFCPRVHCKEKKVLFKNVNDHLKICLKEPIYEEENDGANKFSVWIDSYTELKNKDFWAPSKMTSTCGAVFFISVYVKNDTLYVWVCLLGSSDAAKSFSCKYSMKNEIGEKFTYTGPVHTVDKKCEDIVTSGSLLGIGIDAARRSRNKEKQLEFEITIKNLKEEAKDEDMESGLSDGESL